jgi:hypothetical protein
MVVLLVQGQQWPNLKNQVETDDAPCVPQRVFGREMKIDRKIGTLVAHCYANAC